MKTLISLLLALTTTAVMAAESNPTSNASSQPLDIAKVISVTDTSTACDVVPATMVYIDHQGHTHQLTYSVMGTCSGA